MSWPNIYKVQSGADKKRKRELEKIEWESKNGPVVISKVEIANPNRTKVK